MQRGHPVSHPSVTTPIGRIRPFRAASQHALVVRDGPPERPGPSAPMPATVPGRRRPQPRPLSFSRTICDYEVLRTAHTRVSLVAHSIINLHLFIKSSSNGPERHIVAGPTRGQRTTAMARPRSLLSAAGTASVGGVEICTKYWDFVPKVGTWACNRRSGTAA